MENINYEKFLNYLKLEDKDQALLMIMELFEASKGVVEVYEEYLIPSLLNFECPEPNTEICIWQEHTRTSIIRTILEASYQFVIKQRSKKINKKVIVVCPSEEYHEIGAIIASHYFSLLGFESDYIGANTPNEDIISAIRVLKPDIIALSVTNYYNLVISKKLTERIRQEFPELKIVLGGQGFSKADSLKQLQYDYLLNNYEEILAFRDEVLS